MVEVAAGVILSSPCTASISLANPFFGGLQSFVAEVYRTAVVGLQGEEADGHWAVGLLQHGVCAFEELFQCDEVTVRLTHFLSVHGQHVVVHPIMYHIFPLGSYGLCNLAFVMRGR